MPSNSTGPAPAHRPPAGRRWPLALAAALLVGGAATSLWAWQSSAAYLARQADAEFERYSGLSFDNIGQRVTHQLDLLTGFQALFRASNQVSRAEFHSYFTDLRVQARFPGLLAVQYAKLLDDAQRPAFEAEVRADHTLQPGGYPQFEIHPPGRRDQYLVVVFNEPMQGNEPAFGRDNIADPARREGVERARDSGTPQASAPLQLLQQRPGVLVRLPIYRRGAALASVAQRRAAYVGQINGVLLLDDLLRDTLPSQAEAPYQVMITDRGAIDQTDGPAQRPATLVARTSAQGPGALWATGAAAPQAGDRREHTLAMAGRTWTIEVARPHVDHRTAPFPLLLLGAGLAITLLLSMLAARLTWLRHRAQQLALAMSQQARANAERLDAVFNATVDGILTLDRHGTVLSANQATQRIFGHSAERLVGHSLGLLMPLGAASQLGDWLAPAEPGSTSRRLQARHANGALFAIELGISEMLVDGQRQYVGLLRDMSAAQAAQDRIAQAAQALRAADELREAVFQHAAFALIVADAQGLIQAMNPAAERLLGCSAADEVGRSTLGSFHDAADLTALGHMLHQLQVTAREARSGGEAPANQPRGIERTLVVQRRDGGRVPVSVTVSALHDSDGAVSGFLSIAHDITERQRLAEQLSQLAYHDGLTGLPNRIRLEDHLQQAIAKARRHRDPLALLFIDLDRFKPINDNHGHAVGDQVLCEVARRLQASLRSADLVARLGGDEFVVLLTTLANHEDCLVVADKLLLTLGETMHIGNLALHVGASIGVARYPESGQDAAELLRQADAAMYQVKLAGRHTLLQAGQVDRAQRG